MKIASHHSNRRGAVGISAAVLMGLMIGTVSLEVARRSNSTVRQQLQMLNKEEGYYAAETAALNSMYRFREGAAAIPSDAETIPMPNDFAPFAHTPSLPPPPSPAGVVSESYYRIYTLGTTQARDTATSFIRRLASDGLTRQVKVDGSGTPIAYCGKMDFNTGSGVKVCVSVDPAAPPPPPPPPPPVGPPVIPDHLIFVSSKRYTAQFAAAAADALASADDECSAMAAASTVAEVRSRTYWRAILSNSTINAVDRIVIEVGKSVYNTHGELVASPANPLFSGRLIVPVQYNENNRAMPGTQTGEASPGYESLWTGTNNNGTRRTGPGTCADWTSASPALEATVGNHLRVGGTNYPFNDLTSGVSGGADSSCEERKYIYCISQSESLAPVPPPPPPPVTPPPPPPVATSCPQPADGRILFITQQRFPGNLGGLAGANSLCQTAASAGNLPFPTQFRAVLSTDLQNANAIIPATPKVYSTCNTCTTLVANNLWTSGSWSSLAACNEYGTWINAGATDSHGGTHTWAGSNHTGGRMAGLTCGNWASSSGNGGAGDANDPGTERTYDNSRAVHACNIPLRLYCIGPGP